MIIPNASQPFICESEGCRDALSAGDFVIKVENSKSTFILSAVGASLVFRETYSLNAKQSVGETVIKRRVCSPSENDPSK